MNGHHGANAVAEELLSRIVKYPVGLLCAINERADTGSAVQPGDIAEVLGGRLALSRLDLKVLVHLLHEAGFLEYSPRGGFRLTADGKKLIEASP